MFDAGVDIRNTERVDYSNVQITPFFLSTTYTEVLLHTPKFDPVRVETHGQYIFHVREMLVLSTEPLLT